MTMKSGARWVALTCALGLLVSAGGVSAQSRHDSGRQESRQQHDQGGNRQGGNRQEGERRPPPLVARYPAFGRSVGQPPDGSESLRVGRDSYRYHGGTFYRYRGPGSYIVVRAPIGARVHYLPFGYVSFLLGSRRYFYANFTYYLWDAPTREYVVVAAPQGAEAAVTAESRQGSSELFVYPKEGQSDEQRDRDRYDCYLWAVDQTGFDPSAESPDVTKAGDYRRALSACLEGRGYTVK